MSLVEKILDARDVLSDVNQSFNPFSRYHRDKIRARRERGEGWLRAAFDEYATSLALGTFSSSIAFCALPAFAQDGGSFTVGDKTVTGYALGLDGRPLVGKAFFAINGDTTSYDIGADGRISATLTDIEEVKNKPIPKSFALSNNYPNPFNDKTSFDVSTAKPTVGHIALYNTLGQKVRDWPISLNRGTTTFSMDGELAQGMYFLQVLTPQGRVAQKVLDLDGAVTSKPGLNLSQQSYSSDVPVALDDAVRMESLGKTSSSDVYTMWLEGTNADGVPLTKFAAMRTQNQDPGQENIATSSYYAGFVPAMASANEIPYNFLWYAVDKSVPLDTLSHIIIGPHFSARWENYVTQQFTMDYNSGDPIGTVPDSVFEKQDRLLSELRDIYVFNTPAGTDTLLWTTNERTDNPNWAQRGYNVWAMDNASIPVHSKSYVVEDDIQKLKYSLGRVQATSALGYYYEEYLPAAAVALDDYRPSEGGPRTGFGQMITTVDENNKVVIGKNAYDFLRIGLLFKGKIVGQLD